MLIRRVVIDNLACYRTFTDAPSVTGSGLGHELSIPFPVSILPNGVAMNINVDKLRKIHTPRMRLTKVLPPIVCSICNQAWPCLTASLLDTYEKNKRLREDVRAIMDNYGHTAYCETVLREEHTFQIPKCDCIIGELQHALEEHQ